MAGLKQRWLRVLVLLTCLCLMVVVAQQERAIATQRTLIQALSGDSNDLQRSLAREQARAQQPRSDIYITDSRIAEPKAKPAPAPEPAQEQPPRPARVQKLL